MGSTRNRRSYLSVHTCQAATDHVCVTRANLLAGVDVCRDLKHYTSTLRSFSRKYGKSRVSDSISFVVQRNKHYSKNKQTNNMQRQTRYSEKTVIRQKVRTGNNEFSVFAARRHVTGTVQHWWSMLVPAALKGLEEQRTCTRGLRVRLREMEGDRNCRLHDDHWKNWALHDTHSWVDEDRGRRTCRQTCTIGKPAVTDMRAAGSCWRQKWSWLNGNKWSERKSSH